MKNRWFRRSAGVLVKVSISAVLIFWLLKGIGIARLVEHVASANPLFVILSILTFAISNLLGSVQWYLLLKSKNVKLPLIKVMSYYHVGLFFNNFLIGYIGGDAFRIYDIHKSSGDTTSALTTVFFDRFIGFFAMTALAMFVSLLLLQRFSSLALFSAIAAILLCWILLFVFLFRENMARKLAWIFKPLLPKMVQNRIKDLYFGLNQFRHNKGLLFRILLIALCVQALRVLTHFWAARSIGVEIELSYFYIFIPIIAILASLPISLGGIGIREQSGVALFARVGISSAEVVAFEFLAYIVGIVATIPGGIIFAARREHKSPVINSNSQ